MGQDNISQKDFENVYRPYDQMFIDGEFIFESRVFKHLIVTSLVVFSAGLFTTLFDQIDLFMMMRKFI